MTITTTYKIGSLLDLAEYFDKQSREASERANSDHSKVVEKAHERGMADAFEVAAAILRSTIMDAPHAGS